jgi:peptide/nickel transport system ATP-binding protein
MPASPDALLRVEGVSKAFAARRDLADVIRRRRHGLVALDGVSFELREHQALGVVGESGSGKSTLAKCLVRLEEPDSGTVTLGGRDVRAAGRKELASLRRSMQLIYQDPYSSLNPLMTVGQAVTEPAVVHGIIPDGQTRADWTREILNLVGLPASVASRRPSQLSGGQRQRVAIARAMAVRPTLLIADEPVSALDVSIQAQILNLFEKLRVEQGLAMIFISHQLGVVAHMADTIMVMYLGRVVETGPAREVFRRPAHPYTVGLLESQPGLHRRATATKAALKGEIPSPLNIPTGCRFRTRCPMAQEICKTVDPPAAQLGSGHLSWCHFPADVPAPRIPSPSDDPVPAAVHP